MHACTLIYSGDHGDAADGQHHKRDHAEGGAGRGGEGPPHPQGLARPRLLPRRPPRRRRPRRPARLQPMEVEGEDRRRHEQQRRRLHPLRRRPEAVPGARPGKARGLHLSAPARHQFQVQINIDLLVSLSYSYGCMCMCMCERTTNLAVHV